MALEVPAGLVSPLCPQCHLLWGWCHSPGLVSLPFSWCHLLASPPRPQCRTPRGQCHTPCPQGWCHPPQGQRHPSSLLSPLRPCCHPLRGASTTLFVPAITLLWGWCHPPWLVSPPCPQGRAFVPSLTRWGTGVTPHPQCHPSSSLVSPHVPSVTPHPQHHPLVPTTPPPPPAPSQ